MGKNKYYAVRAGRVPGIYTAWEQAEAQVKGFEGARHKAFDTLTEARAWLRGESAPLSAGQPALLDVPPQPAAEPSAAEPEVILYTDGGAIHNPGPGGYGAVLLAGGRRKELSGGYRLTTNNRMELMAVIAGLSELDRPARVTVYADSQYVVNAVQKGWLARWKARGWRRAGQPIPNADLWQRLDVLLERHPARFEWVRGHAGVRENERCDRLAMRAASATRLAVDEGYESSRGA